MMSLVEDIACALEFGLDVLEEPGDDVMDGLDGGEEADGLSSHHGAGIDVTLLDGASEPAGPEALQFMLSLNAGEFAVIDFANHVKLQPVEVNGASIVESSDGLDGESGVELCADDGVTGICVEVCLFEVGVCTAFG